MGMTTATPLRSDNASQRVPIRRGDRFFYLGMAGVFALVVGWGFLPTLGSKLFHPAAALPRVLFLHAALFSAFVLLLLLQAALIVSRRVAWHRRLGLLGVVLGVLIAIIGTLTALAMSRLHIAQGIPQVEQFLMAPLFDMLAFSVSFGLAIYWRRRPEFHRRMMWMASCVLSVAAFSRLPNWLIPYQGWYAGVDVLILIAAGRDWLVMRRVHPVYLYGFPLLLVGQVATLWIIRTGPPASIAIAHWLLK
jgi:hypothetical protein